MIVERLKNLLEKQKEPSLRLPSPDSNNWLWNQLICALTALEISPVLTAELEDFPPTERGAQFVNSFYKAIDGIIIRLPLVFDLHQRCLSGKQIPQEILNRLKADGIARFPTYNKPYFAIDLNSVYKDQYGIIRDINVGLAVADGQSNLNHSPVKIKGFPLFLIPKYSIPIDNIEAVKVRGKEYPSLWQISIERNYIDDFKSPYAKIWFLTIGYISNNQ